MKRTILLYIAIIIVAIANAATPWKAGTKVSANTVKQHGIEKFFAIDTISNEVYHRMANKSLPKTIISRATICAICDCSITTFREISSEAKWCATKLLPTTW